MKIMYNSELKWRLETQKWLETSFIWWIIRENNYYVV